MKVNYLVMRYLHFRNARGDLQEGHVYAKRLRDYASRCHLSLCSSTKTSILCSKRPKMGVPGPETWGKELGRKFRYGFDTCADCSFKASCEKFAPFMENEVARKNMNL